MNAKDFQGKNWKDIDDLKKIEKLEKVSFADNLRKVLGATNLNQKLTYEKAKTLVDFLDENPLALPDSFGIKYQANSIYTMKEVRRILAIVYAHRELEIESARILNPSNLTTEKPPTKPMSEKEIAELQAELGILPEPEKTGKSA